MENINVTTTVTQEGVPMSGVTPTSGFQTGNLQFNNAAPVFETATPVLTTPVVPLTVTPIAAPILDPIAPTVVTNIVTPPPVLPPQPVDTHLAPIERPENKAKIQSKPLAAAPPVSRPAPLPVVAPLAPVVPVTDFTTPARHHNTTAHVADVAHDPRPLLKVDNEVHDFEVHREGAYAKGHTRPHAGVHKHSDANRAVAGAHDGQAVTNSADARLGPTVAPAGPGLYGPTGYGAPIGPGAERGARTHVHREGLVGTSIVGSTPGATIVNDPRPALPLEREVHDFEVHRQGAHAAGHTRPGAKPEGTYVGAMPATVDVKGNTTNVRVVNPATGTTTAPGALPSTRI